MSTRRLDETSDQTRVNMTAGQRQLDLIQAGRLSPIFFIRESNVVGFTPRSSAAPSAPLIFQLAFSRTAPRFSRSRRTISTSVRNSGPDLSPGSPGCDLDEDGEGAEFVTARSKSSGP